MKRIIKQVKHAIYAQAVKRNQFMIELIHMSVPLMEHLIKYYCADETNPNLHHWAIEIHAFLPKVQKLKNSNKLPPQAFLYEHLYLSSSDSILDWYKSVCAEEHLALPSDTKQMENFIQHYCYWLCSQLSQFGQINSHSVEIELQKLKYEAQNYLI